MTFVHGKGALVTLNASDLSVYAKKVDFEREADSHDVTAFGKTSKCYVAGLKDGKASIEGTYDSGVSGPRAIIEPLLGTVVVMTYKPEGAGTGKPLKTVSVVVTGYKESSPVDDMITWVCDVQLSDDVANTTL